MSTGNTKAVRDSETCWELDEEFMLYAATIPDPPKAGAATTVRLTHRSSCGPFDFAEFFVRVGNSAKSNAPRDSDSTTDWIQARLVEELVTVAEEEMHRSEAQEPFDDETLWIGTYEADLIFPVGQSSIEIKIVSQEPEMLGSFVLTDWEVTVG